MDIKILIYKGGRNMAKILIAVDGSEYGKQCIKEGVKYGKYEPSEFIIVNVKGYLPQRVDSKALYTQSGEKNPDAKERGEKTLQEAAAYLKENFGFEAQTRLMWGDPAEQIINVIDELKPDLVILGTLGATGIKRFLMGSVSNKVVNHAHANVLIVKNLE